MIPILIRFAPFIAVAIGAFGLGFSSAFYVKGVRLTGCKQDHVAYVQDLEQKKIDAEKQADERRKETSDAWAKNLDYLRKCYASGKCLPTLPTSPGGLQSAPGVDGGTSYNLPAPERVAEDCAVTTLQLMTLQADILRAGSK